MGREWALSSMTARAQEKQAVLKPRPVSGPTAVQTISHLEQVVTLEVALYLGALLLGGVLRLLLLDQRPLSVEEGTMAAESYRISVGRYPEALAQAPLTAYGSALALSLFASGDGAARLLQALFGVILVGAPYLLRSSLGRGAAVLAAYGIALSPLLLFASRDVDGGVVAISLGMLLWWALEAGLKDLGRYRVYATALLLAGLVSSGPEGATVLLTLGLASLLAHPQPSALLKESRRFLASPAARQAAALFVGGLLVVGTNFGSNLRGIQSVVVDVWSGWAGSFTLSAPRGSLLLLLGLYEFPVLLLGVAQLFRAVVRRDRTDSFLAFWAMLLLLFSMAQDFGTLSRLVLPVLPLYLLAARLAGDTLHLARRARGDWKWIVASAAVLVPLGVGSVLLNRGTTPAAEVPQIFLYGEAVLVVAGALLVGFLLDGRARVALAWYAVLLVSLGYLLHTTVFLNYNMETVSREPAVGTQLSPALREAALSAAYYSSYYRTPVAVDPQLRGALAWYLRSAGDIQYTANSSQGINIALLQRQQDQLEPGTERRPGLYVPTIAGRDLSWQAAWRWAVLRDGLVSPNQRDIIVRAPAGNW